ncbi:MAG: protease modulator HflC [Chromatiales bacterium]|nr:protease modulator HflC [Chromatiales bacterium]
MSQAKTMTLIIGAIVLWLASASYFVVDERELAVKFRLGEFLRADYQPGIHFKIPFINNVRKFDKRIMTLDAEPESYLTVELKNVIVDAFIKWRISDVSNYYVSMGGDERRAGQRLAVLIKNGLRDEIGKRTIQEAISGERSVIMDIITQQIRDQAAQFGLEVVDVRIKRIELPPEVSESVYNRMIAERDRVAKDLRSRGAEAAERIRADADRQRTVLLAEAYRDAEITRGEGDAQAADIHAQAYSRDASFYEFYRSLNAYRNVFHKPEDLMILDPKSEFFRFFNESAGR